MGFFGPSHPRPVSSLTRPITVSRSRKIKCDAERPFCTGCVRGKRTCSYDEAKGRGRDRQPRQSRIRHLLRAESSDSELGPYQHQQGANDYPNDGGESSSYTPQEQARHPLQGDEQVHEGWGWSNAHSSGSTYGHQHQVNYYRDQPHSSSHTIGDNDPFGVNPRSLSYNSMSRYNSHVLDPDTSPPHSAATLPPRRSPEPSPAILHPSTSIDLIPRIRPSRSEKPNMTALP